MADKNNIFSYMFSASGTKVHMMRETENDELAEKGYDPWQTNRFFSFFYDTVLAANEMNKSYDLPKIMQYEYYLYGVRKAKRKADWPKRAKEEDIDLIARNYTLNINKAKEVLSILTRDQVDEIRYKMSNVGGIK